MPLYEGGKGRLIAAGREAPEQFSVGQLAGILSGQDPANVPNQSGGGFACHDASSCQADALLLHLNPTPIPARPKQFSKHLAAPPEPKPAAAA
jgi:hypothetical protein